MIKKFGEFVNEGWAAGSMRGAVGRNMRKEEIPNTKEQLREIIIKRIEKNPNCDLNGIDVSKIDDMRYLFCADPEKEGGNVIFKDFNGDISGWDVSGVKDMTGMFWGCENFNGDISKWNVSGVKSMYGMFRYCKNFNRDLNGWNISNVDNMYYMFYGCPERPEWYKKTKYRLQEIIYDRIKDEGLECDLNDIDISGISDMSFMFGVEYDYNDPVFKYFNGDVSGWDVSGVTNMAYMFYRCEDFNQDLNNWNVSNVENMRSMFDECTGFRNAKKLKSWGNKLKNCKNTKYMFVDCPTTPSWYKNKK